MLAPALRTLTANAWLALLPRVLIVEYNREVFGQGRMPLQWGMVEVLTALRTFPWIAPPAADEKLDETGTRDLGALVAALQMQ